jgi:cell division protein ZapA (FtsZ GTPase activity inhibitor)
MPKSEIRLDILGTSFTITADEEGEYLEDLLARYREILENTRRQTGVADPLNLAILTGYLLTDEIHKLKNRYETGQEAEELTLDLIARIDEALNGGTG